MGAHPRCQERLMPVAHCRVGDQNLGLRPHPLGKAFRAKLVEPLLGAIGDG